MRNTGGQNWQFCAARRRRTRYRMACVFGRETVDPSPVGAYDAR